jgi:anaerobic magnesium-protoporphyrin IX monomethyl ester cyclase
MRITLISPYPDITNYGLRTLSAVLRKAGHETRFICMPDFAGDGEIDHIEMSQNRYSPEVMEQCLKICEGSDLVGITLMTHYFDSARQITSAVQERFEGKVPVIWGGFHPSARPDECARYADYVAIGDAEDLLLKLCVRLESGDLEDLSDIKGLVWRKGDSVVKNQEGELEQDLDEYPFPDFADHGHWLLFEGELRPASTDLLHRYLRNGTVSRMFGKVGYQTMTGRGCPHACTYCGNSFTRDLYAGQRYVRFRTVENVMLELEEVKRNMPFINFVWFSDDSFFGRSLEEIEDFSREYKKRIDLPFYLLGSPGTITEEKYAPLVDAGLHCIQMGIEHGSKRIQKLMRRSTMGNDKVLRSAEIIAKYAHRTAPPQYDLIYDLPYETLEDKIDTLKLVSQLPKPYKLQVFSVIFYPGTSLHTLALRDGLIGDERAEIYDKMYFEKNDNYANTLLYMTRTGRFPHDLLKVLIDPKVVKVMTSDYIRPMAGVTKKGVQMLRGALNNPVLTRARAMGTNNDLDEARVEGMTGANAGAAIPWGVA